MAGIGNTIDTDLIGELAEVYTRHEGRPSIIARGRIRAATSDGDGHMIVWLELVDEIGVREAHYYFSGQTHGIGDVIAIRTATTVTFLRLIKEQR